MRTLYTVLSLAPSPLFFILGVYSSLHTPAICGAFPYEMTIMWFLMSLAHVTPWILRCQQLYLTRN
jgi:hypothetical protein